MAGEGSWQQINPNRNVKLSVKGLLPRELCRRRHRAVREQGLGWEGLTYLGTGQHRCPQ